MSSRSCSTVLRRICAYTKKNVQETPVAAYRGSKKGPPGFKSAGRPEGRAARMDGLRAGARTLARTGL